MFQFNAPREAQKLSMPGAHYKYTRARWLNVRKRVQSIWFGIEESSVASGNIVVEIVVQVYKNKEVPGVLHCCSVHVFIDLAAQVL